MVRTCDTTAEIRSAPFMLRAARILCHRIVDLKHFWLFYCYHYKVLIRIREDECRLHVRHYDYGRLRVRSFHCICVPVARLNPKVYSARLFGDSARTTSHGRKRENMCVRD